MKNILRMQYQIYFVQRFFHSVHFETGNETKIKKLFFQFSLVSIEGPDFFEICFSVHRERHTEIHIANGR